jgi:hypothetical protein
MERLHRTPPRLQELRTEEGEATSGREERREGGNQEGSFGETRECARCYLTDASQRLGLRFRKRHTTGREEGKISALKKPVRATNEDGRREKRDTDVDDARFSKKQN